MNRLNEAKIKKINIGKDLNIQKNLKEWKEEQADLHLQMEDHSKADQEFYITAGKVLDLSKRAVEIFDSSEISEKRQFVGYLFQNLALNGKKLEYTLRSPFNLIADARHQPVESPLWDTFRTVNWRQIQEELNALVGNMPLTTSSLGAVA